MRAAPDNAGGYEVVTAARQPRPPGALAARLGVAPIAWTNDDLPELGGETPLEVCLAESALAGYAGVETGGKFPRTAPELRAALEAHGLALVSGWYSGRLAADTVAQEMIRIADQLALFGALGATVMVYGETAGTVQNRRDAPLASRPRLADEEFPAYGRRLTALAEHCAGHGVELAFHHHMGTVVETEAEIERLMACTGPALRLLLDTGHAVFAGADPIAIAERHGARIGHVHCKDVRAPVLASFDPRRQSFLDAVLAGVFTVPGDGMIDFSAVARALACAGYEGWFVVEAEQDPAKASPLEYARLGKAALSAALAGAGYAVR